MSGSVDGNMGSLSGGFGDVAEIMVENGWSVFPQTRNREPGMSRDGNGQMRAINWKSDHHLDTNLPDPYVLKQWREDCADDNVACVFGPASNNIFAVDIDITDRVMARRVVKMVLSVLGDTPLKRVGNAPKIALFYRSNGFIRPVSVKMQRCHEEKEFASLPSEAQGLCQKRVVESFGKDVVLYDAFDTDGNQVTDDQMVEIAGTNKLMTIWGIHHKTLRPFQWVGFNEEKGDYNNPLNTKTSEAPLVSQEEVNKALDLVFSFYNEYDSIGSRGYRGGGHTVVWTEDQSGKITDGRENWLWRSCTNLVNEHYRDVLSKGRDGFRELSEHFVEQMVGRINDPVDFGLFGQCCVVDGQWDKEKLVSSSRSKIVRQMRRVINGDVAHLKMRDDIRKVRDGSGGVADRVASGQASGVPDDSGNAKPVNPYSFGVSDEFAWLPVRKENRVDPFDMRQSALNFTALSSGDGRCVAIPEDRSFITDAISDGIQGSITSFLDRVYMHPGDRGYCVSFTEMLVAPTGSGKTSQFLQRIAEDPRTYLPYRGSRNMKVEDEESCNNPFLFLMPNYENIEEQFRKVCLWGLDGSLPDEELALKACERGYGDYQEALRDIGSIRHQAGLVKLPDGVERVNVMIWKGKVRGGCRMADLVTTAGRYGYGSQNFCKRQRPAREIEELPELGKYEFCRFYDECPVIAQREQARTADLIFMPHAFIQLDTAILPEPLKKPRAVLVDERVYQYFIHTETISIDVLEAGRGIPSMTRAESGKYENEEAYVEAVRKKQVMRDMAVDLFLNTLAEGGDPANAFLDHDNGLEMLSATMDLLKGNLRRDMRLRPNMDLKEVVQICDVNTGRGLREELRMWEIVHERMTWLRQDRMTRERMALLQADIDRVTDMIDVCEDAELEKKLRADLDDLAHDLQRESGKIKAKGAYDYRLQVILDSPDTALMPVGDEPEDAEKAERTVLVRFSWRTLPNWRDRPTILLDASAAPEIIEKVWHTNGVVKIPGGYRCGWIPPVGNELVVRNIVSDRDIGRSLNMRVVAVMPWTNSSSSFSGKNGPLHLEKTRQLLDCVSLLHGESRIVCGSNKGLRRRIRDNWNGISNQDWCHYGAMRGLDMFRNHGAAVYVGRLELPVHLLDGLVGALTYDDERPEPPLDIWGTGYRERNEEKTPLMMPREPQVNYVRNGARMSIDVPRMPSFYPVIHDDFVESLEEKVGDELPHKWGQLIQCQYREEEIMQLVGRLRPVYRQGRVPVCYAFSTIIPEHLVIDEVVHVDEIINGNIEKEGNIDRPLPSRRYRIAEFIERHGVIGEHLVELTGDFLSPDVGRMLEMNGMNPETGEVSGRAGRGIGCIAYEYQGEKRYAFCLSYRGYEEACEDIRNLIYLHDMSLTSDVVEFECVSWPVSDAVASVRGEDSVDTVMGKNRRPEQLRDEGNAGLIAMYGDREKRKRTLGRHATSGSVPGVVRRGRRLSLNGKPVTLAGILAERTVEKLEDA